MGAMRSFWASKVECCFCQVVSIRQSINLDPGTPGFQARNAGGLENFDGTRGPVATAIADGSTHLSQEGVSEEHPCYHAFNDQTAKRELGGTIWDIANPGNAYSQAHVVKLLSHSDFEQKIKNITRSFHVAHVCWMVLLVVQNPFHLARSSHYRCAVKRLVSMWNLFIGAAPVTSNEHVRWEIVRWRGLASVG